VKISANLIENNNSITSSELNLLSMIKFRVQMGSKLYQDLLNSVYTPEYISSQKKIIKGYKRNISDQNTPRDINKISIAQKNISNLIIKDFVQFIGISGSVGAGISQEFDDIDIFIVLKDHTVWLYRLVIWLKNLNKKNIRRRTILPLNLDKKIRNNLAFRDKLCINYLIEESSLNRIEKNIFNLHEIHSLIPIYNTQYKNHLMSICSSWVDSSLMMINSYTPNSQSGNNTNIFVRIADFLAFCAQALYMLYHGAKILEIFSARKNGYIKTFDLSFAREILRCIK